MKHTAPYIPFSTFRRRMNSLGDYYRHNSGSIHHLGKQRDFENVLDALKISGSSRSELLGALRFLGLVDDDTQLNRNIAPLLERSEDVWNSHLQYCISESYSPAILKALAFGKSAELLEEMKAIASPSTITKAIRFLHQAAEATDMRVSPDIPKPPSERDLMRSNTSLDLELAHRARRKMTRAIEVNHSRPKPSAKSEEVSYPFPLRADSLVQINGIPMDLTLAEAKRLSAFIHTLAQDYEADT